MSIDVQSEEDLHKEKFDFTKKNFTILFKTINEAQLAEVVQTFNLNPISLWDIMLKLNFDKIHKLSDTNAIFFNFSQFTDISKNKK